MTGVQTCALPICRFSSLAIVKEVATNQSNLWKGPSQPNAIERFDTTLPSEAISSWKSSLGRSDGEFASTMIRVGALNVWMRGSGSPVVNVYAPDYVTNVPCVLMTTAGVPAVLSAAPGLIYESKLDLDRVENYSVEFVMPANQWMEISGFQVFAKPSAFNR